MPNLDPIDAFLKDSLVVAPPTTPRFNFLDPSETLFPTPTPAAPIALSPRVNNVQEIPSLTALALSPPGSYLGQLLKPPVVNIDAPIGKDPVEQAYLQEQLRNPQTEPSRFQPFGLNPQVNYPVLPQDDTARSVWDYPTQGGLGLLQVPSQTAAALSNFGSLLSGSEPAPATSAHQLDVVGQEMPRGDTVRHAANIVGGLVPFAAAGAIGATVGAPLGAAAATGIVAQALLAGAQSAGDSYEKAIEARYPHAEAYAYGSGILNALLMGAAGKFGLGAAAGIKEVLASPSWKSFAIELGKHTSAGAGLMAATGALQGTLDSLTITPDMTGEDIVKSTFEQAGIGAALGLGMGTLFGGLKFHKAVEAAKPANQIGQSLKQFNADVENAQFKPTGDSLIRPDRQFPLPEKRNRQLDETPGVLDLRPLEEREAVPQTPSGYVESPPRPGVRVVGSRNVLDLTNQIRDLEAARAAEPDPGKQVQYDDDITGLIREIQIANSSRKIRRTIDKINAVTQEPPGVLDEDLRTDQIRKGVNDLVRELQISPVPSTSAGEKIDGILNQLIELIDQPKKTPGGGIKVDSDINRLVNELTLTLREQEPPLKNPAIGADFKLPEKPSVSAPAVIPETPRPPEGPSSPAREQAPVSEQPREDISFPPSWTRERIRQWFADNGTVGRWVRGQWSYPGEFKGKLPDPFVSTRARSKAPVIAPIEESNFEVRKAYVKEGGSPYKMYKKGGRYPVAELPLEFIGEDGKPKPEAVTREALHKAFTGDTSGPWKPLEKKSNNTSAPEITELRRKARESKGNVDAENFSMGVRAALLADEYSTPETLDPSVAISSAIKSGALTPEGVVRLGVKRNATPEEAAAHLVKVLQDLPKPNDPNVALAQLLEAKENPSESRTKSTGREVTPKVEVAVAESKGTDTRSYELKFENLLNKDGPLYAKLEALRETFRNTQEVDEAEFHALAEQVKEYGITLDELYGYVGGELKFSPDEKIVLPPAPREINPETVKALDYTLERLRAIPGLREFVDRIEIQRVDKRAEPGALDPRAAGMFVRLLNRIVGDITGGKKIFPHEFAHALESLISPQDWALIEAARQDAIRKLTPDQTDFKYSASDPEAGLYARMDAVERSGLDDHQWAANRLRSGLSSQEHVENFGLGHEFYHLSNTSEFWAAAFADRILKEMTPAQQGIVAKAKQVLKALWDALKRVFGGKLPPATDQVFEKLMKGEYSPEELRQVSNETRNIYETESVPKFDKEMEQVNTPEEGLTVARRSSLQNDYPGLGSLLNKVNDPATPMLAKARDIVRGIIAPRQEVRTASGFPTEKYSKVYNDPNTPSWEAQAIALSAFNNSLHINGQVGGVKWKTLMYEERVRTQLADVLSDAALAKATRDAKQMVVDRAVSDLKQRLATQRYDAERAVDSERQLHAVAQRERFVDMLGDNADVSKRMLGDMAQRIPDAILYKKNVTPQELLTAWESQFATSEELLKAAQGSVDTVSALAQGLGSYAHLQEDLIALRVLHDPAQAAALKKYRTDLQNSLTTNAEGAIDKLATLMDSEVPEKAKADAAYKLLMRKKGVLIRNARAYRQALNELETWQNSPDFKAHLKEVYEHNGVSEVLNTKGVESTVHYRNPMNPKEIIPVSPYAFDRDTILENHKNLDRLWDLSDQYLNSGNTTPEGDRAWRSFRATYNYTRDPSIDAGGKHIPGIYNIFRARGVFGVLTRIPENVLAQIGGRPAAEAGTHLQALTTYLGQVGNKTRAPILEIKDAIGKALKSHSDMPYPVWHEQVHDPLAASYRRTGIGQLSVGSKIPGYDHIITKEDIAVLKAEQVFVRAVNDAATEGEGSIVIERHKPQIDVPVDKYLPKKYVGSLKVGDTIKTMTRRASELTDITLPRVFSGRASAWASLWASKPTEKQRVQLINDNFDSWVTSHVTTLGSPDYSAKSPLLEFYRQVVADGMPENLSDFAKAVADKTTASGTRASAWNEASVTKQVIEEMDTMLNRVANELGIKDKKADPSKILVMIDSDNSFTKERGNLVAPPSFYDWGAPNEPQQVSFIQSGESGFAAKAISSLESLEKSLGAHKLDLESQLKSNPNLKKELKAAQKREEAVLTFHQTIVALRRVSAMRSDYVAAENAKRSHAANPMLSGAIDQTVGFVVGNALASYSSNINNLHGGVGNMLLVGSLTGQNLFKYTPHVIISIAKSLINQVPGLNKIPGLESLLAAAHLRGLDDHETLTAAGMRSPQYAIKETRNYANIPGGAYSSNKNPTAGDTAQRGIRSVFGVLGTGLSSTFPRVADNALNETQARLTVPLLDGMRMRALEFYPTMKELATKAGRDPWDVSDIDNRIPEAAFGMSDRKSSAIYWREIFSRQNLSFDGEMLDYLKAWDAARPEDRANVPFLTDAKLKAVAFQLAQQVNLAAPYYNRPLPSKWNKLNRMLLVLQGFSAFQGGTAERALSYASNDTAARALISALPRIAIILGALGVVSQMGSAVKAVISRKVSKEEPSVPSILDAKSLPEAFAATVMESLGLWGPYVGGFVANLTNSTHQRIGWDFNKQIFVANLLTDVVSMVRKVSTSGTIERPLLDFVTRWSPVLRPFVNRLDAQEGIVAWKNDAKALKNAAGSDPSLESLRRGQGSGGYTYTKTTPIILDMVNAAYRGDKNTFLERQQHVVQLLMEDGRSQKDAENAVKSAFAARSPWAQAFKTQPTHDQRERILGNMSPENAQAIRDAEAIFTAYGADLGRNIRFEKAEKTAGAQPQGIPITGGKPSFAGSNIGGTIKAGGPSIAGAGTFGGSSASLLGSVGGKATGGGSSGSSLLPKFGKAKKGRRPSISGSLIKSPRIRTPSISVRAPRAKKPKVAGTKRPRRRLF